MTLATPNKRGTTPMTTPFSPTEAGGIFPNPPSKSRTLRASAKMGESLFIVEYDGSVPLNVPENWPLPSYEVRRKLPMKECEQCRSDIYEGRAKFPKARKTSWIARRRGEFYWLRVCFEHMHPEVRTVIKEMYSR